MNLLLDTSTFLWFATDPGQLSARAVALLQDPANTLWLSVVSVWEIIQKNRLGKLPLTADIEQIVREQVQTNNIRLLPLDLRDVLEGRALPLHHRDPFDRLLICQAVANQLVMLSPDSKIGLYPVTVEW